MTISDFDPERIAELEAQLDAIEDRVERVVAGCRRLANRVRAAESVAAQARHEAEEARSVAEEARQ
jgi:hypothetical protein